jgi:myxalamid-type polyketide synthase MxaE and MxaD
MEPAQAEFEPVARGARMKPLEVPMVSTVSGARLEPGTTLDARYWVDHLRAPVRFADAVATASTDVDVLLEVGASGGLVPCMLNTARGTEAIPLLRRALADSWEPALTALGRLTELGVAVDLRALESSPAACSSYPYVRRRLWLSPTAVDVVTPTPAPTWALTSETELYARDHVAAGRPIAPGSRLMELALDHLEARPIALTDLIHLRPLSVSDGDRLGSASEGADGSIVIESFTRDHAVPVLHFRALRGATPGAAPTVDVDAVRARCGTPLSPERLYQLLADTGMTYGPTMTTVAELQLGDRELLATLIARDERPSAFHPAVVDGAMQAIGAFFAADDAPVGEPRPMFLGFSVGRLTAFGPVPRRALAHIELAELPDANAETIRATVSIADEHGTVAARFEDVGLKRVGSAPPRARTIDRRPRTVALIAGPSAPGARLRRTLEDLGIFVLPTTDARADFGPVDAVIGLAPADPAALERAAAERGLPVVMAATIEDALSALTGMPRRNEHAVLAPADDGGISEFLRAQLGAALRIAAAAVDPRAPFARLGVDSLMAVDLVLRLERRYGTKLYPTLLFEYQTIDAVAQALRERFGVREA